MTLTSQLSNDTFMIPESPKRGRQATTLYSSSSASLNPAALVLANRVPSPKKIDVETLLKLKVQDSKRGQNLGKLTLVEKHSSPKRSNNNQLADTISRQRASLRASVGDSSSDVGTGEAKNQDLLIKSFDKVSDVQTPHYSNTMRIMDQGDNLRQMMQSVVSSPNERSLKLIARAEALGSNKKSTVSILSSDEEVHELSYRKMKIDLSNVSFLKPHISNDQVYKMAQSSVSKEHLRVPEHVKNLEQQRRYKRFKGTYESRNRNSHAVTTSCFPKKYNVNNVSFNASVENDAQVSLTQRDHTAQHTQANFSAATAPMNTTVFSRKLANLESLRRKQKQAMAATLSPGSARMHLSQQWEQD